jgi:hypothetical protein
MREHATMLHANRLNGDKPGEESVRKAMKKLVDEYMAALEQDKEDGLDPDTARTWKEQAQDDRGSSEARPADSELWSEQVRTNRAPKAQ